MFSVKENKTQQEEAQVRAALYNMFADIFARKLDSSWLNPQFQRQLSVGLPEVRGQDEVLDILTQASENEKVFQSILLDYDALLVVPGPTLTFPYESCYTYRNADGSFGRLWQVPAQKMQRILKEWQIQFAEGWDLIPDHFAVELFFMGNLCHLSVEAQEIELKTLQEWQKKFFAEHLKSWAFEFLANVERKAQSSFYRGMAKLLIEFLREEEAALGE